MNPACPYTPWKHRCVIVCVFIGLLLSPARALPPVIANLAVALDGSEVSTTPGGDGETLVVSWLDQATGLGGVQNFVAFDALAAPRFLPGQTMPYGQVHNLVAWDGRANQWLWRTTDSFFDKGTASGTDYQTWFVVFSCNHLNAKLALIETCFFNRGVGSFLQSDDSLRSRYYQSNSSTVADTAGLEPERWYILTGVFNGSRSSRNGYGSWSVNQFLMDQDGDTFPPATASGLTAALMYHFLTALGATPIPVFNQPPENSGSTDIFNGRMAEVLIYNDCLVEVDRLAVEAYLFEKYFSVVESPTGIWVTIR